MPQSVIVFKKAIHQTCTIVKLSFTMPVVQLISILFVALLAIVDTSAVQSTA